MQDVLIGSVVAVGCLLGVLMTALRLPGTWWIVLLALGVGWWSGWTSIAGNAIWVLAGLAVIGEAAEFGVSVLTARRAGASRRAAVCGTIGGFVGMLAGVAIPPPLIGPIVGAVIGCFTGALIGEVWKRDRLDQGMRVGLFAAIGFALGMALKTTLALCMSTFVVWKVCSAGSP